jgi:hypothetical protein
MDNIQRQLVAKLLKRYESRPATRTGADLAKQRLHLHPGARPGGRTAPPHAQRRVARAGTPRRARVPSMHYLDDPIRRSILDAKSGVDLDAN